MERKLLIRLLKECTPTQLKRISEILELNYDFLNLAYNKRIKSLDLEYKLSMSESKIKATKKEIIIKITNGLNDDAIKKELKKLLNIS